MRVLKADFTNDFCTLKLQGGLIFRGFRGIFVDFLMGSKKIVGVFQGGEGGGGGSVVMLSEQDQIASCDTKLGSLSFLDS